jgi:hypothetical protein
MTTKPTAAPALQLRVLHVSLAGQKVVKVVPDGDTIKIGEKTWKCTREHTFPQPGKFQAIAVDGQAECVKVYDAAGVMSPEWVDALANSNIVKQIHDLTSGGKKQPVPWANIIMNGILILAVVAVGIVLHGDIADVHDDLVASHAVLQPPPPEGSSQGANGGDTIQVNQGNSGG